jgi:hypothetical protein
VPSTSTTFVRNLPCGHYEIAPTSPLVDFAAAFSQVTRAIRSPAPNGQPTRRPRIERRNNPLLKLSVSIDGQKQVINAQGTHHRFKRMW